MTRLLAGAGYVVVSGGEQFVNHLGLWEWRNVIRRLRSEGDAGSGGPAVAIEQRAPLFANSARVLKDVLNAF
jgi:hypothetical protein